MAARQWMLPGGVYVNADSNGNQWMLPRGRMAGWRQRYYLNEEAAAGGASGSGAQTLPALTQLGSAVMQPEATAAQVLPSLAQSGSGAQEIIASAAQQLPSVIQSGVGVLEFDATAAQQLPSLEQAGDGVLQPEATAAQTLPALTQEASGTGPGFTLVASSTFTVGAGAGTETKSLPGTPLENDVVWIMVGCDTDIGTLGPDASEGYTSVYNQPSVVAMWVGYKVMGATPDTDVDINQSSVVDTAGIIQVWRGADTSDVVDNGHSAESNFLDVTMPDPPEHTTTATNVLRMIFGMLDDDIVASSVTAPSGYSNLSAEEAGTAGTGCTVMMASKVSATPGAEDPAAFGGTGSDNWRAVHLAMKASNSVDTAVASGAQTLPSLSQAASAIQAFEATGSQTLPSLEQSGTAELQQPATAEQTLPSLVQSASGDSPIESTGAQTLPGLVQAGVGNLPTASSGAQVLPALTQSASALLEIAATAALTLPALTQLGQSQSWVKVGQSTFTTSSGSGTESKSLPAGLAQNDIVVVVTGGTSTAAAVGALGTGWTSFVSVTGTHAVHGAWKKMGGSPDSAVDITRSDSAMLAGLIQVWRGADPDAPVDNDYVFASAGSGYPNPPSHRTITDNALRLVVGYLDDDDDASNVAAPSGYGDLLAADTGQASSTVGSTVMIASKTQDLAGTDDPAAFSGSDDDAWRAYHFALRWDTGVYLWPESAAPLLIAL